MGEASPVALWTLTVSRRSLKHALDKNTQLHSLLSWQTHKPRCVWAVIITLFPSCCWYQWRHQHFRVWRHNRVKPYNFGCSEHLSVSGWAAIQNDTVISASEVENTETWLRGWNVESARFASRIICTWFKSDLWSSKWLWGVRPTVPATTV